MKYKNIREEELKNNVAQDYFWLYNCAKIIGNVDFCVSMPTSNKGIYPLVETQSLLWAEAKKESSDIYKSLVQLILTIGKARTFNKYLPPSFLGAFDGEKIAFVPFSDIHDIFYLNDFNRNVAPSNYETKEFKLLYNKLMEKNSPPCMEGWTPKADGEVMFHYEKDDKELRRFIKNNFADNKFGVTKIKIDKNNFMVIYNKWLDTVQPTIAVKWDKAKAKGIISGDFYLADLLSAENKTLKEKLFVFLHGNYYEFERVVDEDDFYNSKRAEFSDNQKAHTQFWNRYERPPKEEYWDYITNRRDLLVPQDVRERKGSFFTPRIWVALSQKYLADVLGEDWQDEYYIWDCCAGTGNLLNGLVNKYNIWASTLDKADVDVMQDRVDNGANLFEYGVNHWIPFTEYGVGAKEKFSCSFMTDFIAGKEMREPAVSEALFFYDGYEFGGGGGNTPQKREFSQTAKELFKAGGDLWRYYHKQPNINVNASLYDIREYFQGRNHHGKMNNKSNDENYNQLIENLRITFKSLSEKIEPKIYEYGFLLN